MERNIMNDNKLTTGMYMPTQAEQKLLDTLADTKIYGSISQLCAEAGVDRTVWYDALKKPDFVGKLLSGSSSILYASFPAIVNKISKQAIAGSFPQQKMILEMMKVYQEVPQVAIQNNAETNNYFGVDTMEQAFPLWLQLALEDKTDEGGTPIKPGCVKALKDNKEKILELFEM